MPLFEYRCEDCEETFERLEWRHEAGEPAECPACGSVRTERCVSAFATRGSRGSSEGAGCSSRGGGGRSGFR